MPRRKMIGMPRKVGPKRTVAHLKELHSLTADENGAQRVAFTTTWARARKWLRSKFEQLPEIEVHNDAAGNLWATLPGRSERALLIGGHIDSVANGGWLDGCLDTLAGLEVLRRINCQYKGKPVTVRVVDWTDEEGARFGKSLFGSSSCSGKIDVDETRSLKDREGVRLVDAIQDHGIDFQRVRFGPGVETRGGLFGIAHRTRPDPARSRSRFLFRRRGGPVSGPAPVGRGR
jgi:N-carbamoyl-L-amino-acid hydrolase